MSSRAHASIAALHEFTLAYANQYYKPQCLDAWVTDDLSSSKVHLTICCAAQVVEYQRELSYSSVSLMNCNVSKAALESCNISYALR